jgi:hypothetical protein
MEEEVGVKGIMLLMVSASNFMIANKLTEVCDLVSLPSGRELCRRARLAPGFGLLMTLELSITFLFVLGTFLLTSL